MMSGTWSNSQAEASSQIKKSDIIKHSLLLIRTFVKRGTILVSIWVILFFTGSFLLQNMYHRAWKEDDIPYFMFFFDVGIMFQVGAILALLKYIHDSSIKHITQCKSSSSNENRRVDAGSSPSGGAVAPVINLQSTNLE